MGTSPVSYLFTHYNLLLTWTLFLFKLHHFTSPSAKMTATTRCHLAAKCNYRSQ